MDEIRPAPSTIVGLENCSRAGSEQDVVRVPWIRGKAAYVSTVRSSGSPLFGPGGCTNQENAANSEETANYQITLLPKSYP
jgi:hypothetical protein